MQKHVYSMFPVLSSPLNHTQNNQNKVMPLTYRTEFENKIKNMEKQTIEKENNVIKPNSFSGGMGINYIRNYRNVQTIKIRTITPPDNENINRNLGRGSRVNRFFSLSTMRNGGGCGCG